MSTTRVEHMVSFGLASLAAASGSGAARAESSGAPREQAAVDLAWNAPADCPTREVFLAELARALGPAGRGRVPSRTSVDITSAGGEGWTATVRIATEGVSSERVLHAENCQTLASAAAVIAAVAIEGPTGGASTETRPIARSEESRDRATRADTRSPGPSQPELGAAAILDDGTMPSLSPGVEGKIGFASRVASFRVRVEGSGALFETRDAVAPGHPLEGGSFSLLTAGGRVCGTRVFGALEAGPCLGGEVDFMSGSGTGTTTSGAGSRAWGAVNGSAFGAWNPTRGFGLTVRVDGVLPFARPPFVITRAGGDIFVHQPFWVTFRAAVGIELRFF